MHFSLSAGYDASSNHPRKQPSIYYDHLRLLVVAGLLFRQLSMRTRSRMAVLRTTPPTPFAFWCSLTKMECALLRVCSQQRTGTCTRVGDVSRSHQTLGCCQKSGRRLHSRCATSPSARVDLRT